MKFTIAQIADFIEDIASYATTEKASQRIVFVAQQLRLLGLDDMVFCVFCWTWGKKDAAHTVIGKENGREEWWCGKCYQKRGKENL